MIDAVEFLPGSDRVVADVAFDELVRGLHRERLIVEWLRRLQLSHHEVGVFQQRIVGSQNEIVRTRLRIDRGSELHAKVLNHRLRALVDDAQVECLLGDVEVRLDLQRRQQQRLPVVGKAVFGDPVGRQRIREIFFQPQQVSERVPILRHGQPSYGSVLWYRARSRGSHCSRDPIG